jgi:hypothetical protein
MPDPIPDINVNPPDIPQVPNPFGNGRRNVGDPFTSGGVNQLNNGGMGPNALTTGTNNTGTPGGPGTGNTGGGNTGGPGSRPGAIAPPDDGFYYDRPPNQAPTPPPVIGDPASGFNNDAGWFANPQNVGGGSSFGVGKALVTASAAMENAAGTIQRTFGGSGTGGGSGPGNNRAWDAFIARNSGQYFEFNVPGKTIRIQKARLLTDPDVLNKYLNDKDPRVRKWAEGLQARLASGDIRDRNPESLAPLMAFFRKLFEGRGPGTPGTPGTGNVYNIYGMQVGDVQREIERAERRLATNWTVKYGG